MTQAPSQSPQHQLAALLADPRIEEVMINGPHKAFVISGGRKRRVELQFRDDHELRDCISRLISLSGRTLDETTPLADVRLADGSRLNAVIAPLAPATTVTIRRFVLRERTLDDLVTLRMLSQTPASFLRSAVMAGLNFLICGGTSTGKTTLLNGLCACIDGDERVITIEETRELYLDHALEDVCSLESHLVGGTRITIRDLVKNALRMRPNRIIVGEVRGAEALDVLTAMTSGHQGSMCTIHADTPREALHKLYTYTLMTGEGVPDSAARDMIARALNLVVLCKRGRDGESRHVDTIYEVTGVQGDVITGQELFVQRDGELRWTGVRPQCEAWMRAEGYDVSALFRDTAFSFERRLTR
jgi:pilus assembly protein CpaF